MTSFKQFEANRRNALRSTGPKSEEGKKRSRRNAIRHGLTAETVISDLEDTEDYDAFEATVIADYNAQSAVERELVLRLASLLWRLRRATAIETGLFENNGDHHPFTVAGTVQLTSSSDTEHPAAGLPPLSASQRQATIAEILSRTSISFSPAREVAGRYLRLSDLPNCAIDRLNRYEFSSLAPGRADYNDFGHTRPAQAARTATLGGQQNREEPFSHGHRRIPTRVIATFRNRPRNDEVPVGCSGSEPGAETIARASPMRFGCAELQNSS